MKIEDLLIYGIDPALSLLEELCGIKQTEEGLLWTLTIAGQESSWKERRQIGGPARSFWQFEKNGGAAELFQKTPTQLQKICAELSIPYDLTSVFEAMAWNDILAASMGRLLLWQDPNKLPDIHNVQGGWDYYERNWRPGAPRPADWPGNYNTALQYI